MNYSHFLSIILKKPLFWTFSSGIVFKLFMNTKKPKILSVSSTEMKIKCYFNSKTMIVLEWKSGKRRVGKFLLPGQVTIFIFNFQTFDTPGIKYWLEFSSLAMHKRVFFLKTFFQLKNWAFLHIYILEHKKVIGHKMILDG